MLVDVDASTWSLLLNQIAALELAGSKLVVFAIAYTDNICKIFFDKNVPCYYEDRWVKALFTAYRKWTGHTRPNAQNLVNIQLGRMITTLITICEGRNVFLSDGDVVFFRNPMDYVYDNVNIMITSTAIKPAPEWGAPYFADQPKQYYTLNNGVVYYRSNAVTKDFLMQLTVNCIAVLNKGPDPLAAFLQTEFHAYMRNHSLLVHPSRDVSNSSTFKLESNYSNRAGECYDCYYGDVTIPTEYKRQIGIASNALKRNETTHWGWGEQEQGTSRLLAVHANCILGVGEIYTSARFDKKVKWFQYMNSWFIE
eukprot:gene15298-17506_t